MPGDAADAAGALPPPPRLPTRQQQPPPSSHLSHKLLGTSRTCFPVQGLGDALERWRRRAGSQVLAAPQLESLVLPLLRRSEPRLLAAAV